MIIKMYAFAMNLLCFFIIGCCAAQTTSIETTTDLATIISETEIGRNASGHCTFEIKKGQSIVVPIHYTDTHLQYGRCRGFANKLCQNQILVAKTRYENQIVEIKDTVVRCCDGYISNIDNDKCLPVCEHNCFYGKCTAPNVCSCNEGYELSNKSNICRPKCGGCEHGFCIGPNLCFCRFGYSWNSEKSECVPVCDGMCHNGKCVAPQKCECNAGYDHHPWHSVCIPHCNETCVNGQCMGPNKCECDFGYQFANGSQSVCEPICEMSCKNAKCVSPNVCECHNGYSVLDDQKPHECHCGQYCVEIDGMCHCLDDDHRINGDVIRNNMSSICTESTCANGVCLTLYDCECYDGFEKDESSNCVAVNETCIDDPSNCNGTEIKTCNCINGICDANYACVCVNGFKMSEGHNDLCEPSCSNECVNGFCMNPDECKCHTGYRLDFNAVETHICHPICDPEAEHNNGCGNGTCISPGTCQCYEGFKLSAETNFNCECDIGYRLGYDESKKKMCRPICNPKATDNNGCLNGTCIAPGTCHCYEGFKLSTRSNFTCSLDPIHAEQFTGKTHWLITSVSIIAILVTALFAIVYSYTNWKMPNYKFFQRNDEATEPIAKHVHEEL